MKILIATSKPFDRSVIDEIKKIFDDANYTSIFLERYMDRDELLAKVEDIDAIITRSDIVDRALIDRAKKLKLIVRAGSGTDNIDIEYAKEKIICVMNTPGQNANAVAELVFGLLIYNIRNTFNGTIGHELKGKKIGIHAFGYVGQNVARIALGFGMDVYAFDPFVAKDKIIQLGVKHVESVEELYKTCDIISLHLPVTSNTLKLINYSLLKNLPTNAIIVNSARAEIIDEDDLVQILTEREDIKYISDIRPSNHPLLKKSFPDRYYSTPIKSGAQTVEANANAGISAAKQIIDFFERE